MDYDLLKKALDAAIDPESDEFKRAVAKAKERPPEISRELMLHELSGAVAEQLNGESEFAKGRCPNQVNRRSSGSKKGIDKLTRKHGLTLPKIAHPAPRIYGNTHFRIFLTLPSHRIPTFQRANS